MRVNYRKPPSKPKALVAKKPPSKTKQLGRALGKASADATAADQKAAADATGFKNRSAKMSARRKRLQQGTPGKAQKIIKQRRV